MGTVARDSYSGDIQEILQSVPGLEGEKGLAEEGKWMQV